MSHSSAADGYRDPERWKQMEALLEAIESLDAQSVPDFLKGVCQDDPLLAEQVLDFWQRAQQADDLLEAPVLEGLGLIFDEERDLTAELANLPDCRVLEKLGEGGMGRVYLVEQNAPTRRLVALKVLLAACSPERLKRFQLEMGALARMNHENVARLYHFGFTPDRHIPFYLMEYFPGLPITEFALQQGLSLEQRLRLMLQVFQGVEHAHQKGLIHRDIKPSNILVALREGKFQVKLIDFGIAKALEKDSGSSETLTDAGHVLGTPVYMSPEQWDPGSELIDTRSDIYSLGAVLYELVSGHPTIDGNLLKELSLSGKLAYIRTHRPRQLSQFREAHLPPELDWVFEKATRIEKAERYPSISHFASDIEAILSDRPVLARPKKSAFYMARKLLQRHRRSLALGLIIVAFLGVLAGMALRNHFRNQTFEKRTRDAFAVLGQALAAPNIRLKGPAVTLVDVIKGLDETMPQDLDPIVRAKVLSFAAETFSSLEENEVALCYATEAADLMERSQASTHDIAANQLVLARLHQLAGNFEQAEPLYTAALSTEALKPKEKLRALSGRAEVFRLSGQPQLAIDIYEDLPEEAVADRNQVARWRGLADCYTSIGAFEEASAVYTHALEESIRETGSTSTDTLWVQLMYEHLLRRQGKLSGAPVRLGKLFAQAKRCFGLEHRLTLDAWLAMTAAELAEACPVVPEVEPELILEIAERLNAPPVTWRVSLRAASQLKHQGRYDQAERALENLLEQQHQRVKWDNEDLLRTASDLADTYRLHRNPALGVSLLSELLTARRTKGLTLLEADFLAHVTLAEVQLALDRKTEAKAALQPLHTERPIDQWQWPLSTGVKEYVQRLAQQTGP